MSVSLISHHFGGREELLDECQQVYFDALVREEAAWRARLADTDGGTIGAFCEDLCEAGYRFGVEWRPLVRYTVKRTAERGGLAARWRDGVQRAALTWWGEAIAARTGLDDVTTRLRFHAAVTHLARLVMASPADLEELTGSEHRVVQPAIVAHVRSLGRFVASTNL